MSVGFQRIIFFWYFTKFFIPDLIVTSTISALTVRRLSRSFRMQIWSSIAVFKNIWNVFEASSWTFVRTLVPQESLMLSVYPSQCNALQVSAQHERAQFHLDLSDKIICVVLFLRRSSDSSSLTGFLCCNSWSHRNRLVPFTSRDLHRGQRI